METKKQAIEILIEIAILGVMHKCNFQVTKLSKNILDDILRSAFNAGLEVHEIMSALKKIEKRLQDSGRDVVFEFEYEDNMRQ